MDAHVPEPRRPVPSAGPILVLLAAAWTSAALNAQVRDRTLKKGDESRILKLVEVWSKAKESDRPARIEDILDFGLPGMRFLATKTTSPPADAIAREIPSLRKRLGEEILGREVSVSRKEHPSPVRPGEIMVFSRESRFAALRIRKSPAPESGSLVADWYVTETPVDRFGTAARKTGVLEAKGQGSVARFKRLAGYPSFSYTISFEGFDAALWCDGPGLLTYVYDLKTLAAFTSETDPKALKGGDQRLRYRSSYPGAWTRAERLSQFYLFNIIDGLEPLKTFGTAAEAKFADYEDVQVLVREIDGSPVVYVVFPFKTDVAFGPREHRRLWNFVNEIMDVAPENILVAAGNAEIREANKFFDGKGFSAASGALKQRLRRIFPEDY